MATVLAPRRTLTATKDTATGKVVVRTKQPQKREKRPAVIHRSPGAVFTATPKRRGKTRGGPTPTLPEAPSGDRAHHFTYPVARRIERAILTPLRNQCAEALYGLRGFEAIIERNEQELNALTVTADSPDGLDFSDGGEGRAALYRMREGMQEHYGLYFIGDRGSGIRFTIHPLIGMLWREQEFEERALHAANQLARMWRFAIAALGRRAPDGAGTVTKAAEERSAILLHLGATIRGELPDASTLTPPKRPPVRG